MPRQTHSYTAQKKCTKTVTSYRYKHENMYNYKSYQLNKYWRHDRTEFSDADRISYGIEFHANQQKCCGGWVVHSFINSRYLGFINLYSSSTLHIYSFSVHYTVFMYKQREHEKHLYKQSSHYRKHGMYNRH